MEVEGDSAQRFRGADPTAPGQMMGWARASDADIVARLKAGDPRAFEEVLGRYQVKIYSLARGLTRNDEDAQDVLQDTFLSIFKSIKSFKGDSSLSTWIYRVTVNAALMQMRKRRKERQTVPIEDYLPRFDDDGHRVAVVPDWYPLVDQLLMNKELGGLLRDWIAALHADYRTVFVMRDQEEMSTEEVASVLGLTVAAVKSRLQRARLYLRERAKRYVYSGGR